jgi:hypothetical protein
MKPGYLLAAVSFPMTVVVTACDTAAVTPSPSAVPGAAATAARAAATPIPTAAQSPTASPVAASPPRASPPAAPSPGLSPSPNAVGQGAMSEQSIAETRRAVDQTLNSPELPGIEALLIGTVSLSSPAGGTVLEREAAARWLRERAGPNIRIAQVQPYPDLALLEIVTEGWQPSESIGGRLVFRLHPYAESGRQDEERGRWKIDVIATE